MQLVGVKCVVIYKRYFSYFHRQKESQKLIKVETEYKKFVKTNNPQIKVISGTTDKITVGKRFDNLATGQNWTPADGHSTLRKSAVSTEGGQEQKTPITSTVISNVRGKSILSQKQANDRKSEVASVESKGTQKDLTGSVKIANVVKI